MCTIAILLGVGEVPLVLAANRDELYARPTRPPERLAPHIAGGVDVQSGGTWLAVRADGFFAAVTNQRALAAPPPHVRSRGLIVRELASAADPDGYVAALDPRAYASMNLAWGNADGVTLAYLRHDGTKELEPLSSGIHVLCNDRLGAPGFPRGERLAAAIATHVEEPWHALAGRLAVALADHTRVTPPPSHLAPALARELTATCIHSEHYGTRSSTIAALERGRVRAYLHADGPPCVTEFADRRELLYA